MKEKKHGLLTNAIRKAMKKSRNDEELLASLATASNELDDEDLFLVAGGAQYEATKEQMEALLGDNSGLSAETQSAIQALIYSAGGSSFGISGSNAQTDSNHNSNDSSPVAVFTDGGTAVFNGNVLEKPTIDPNISFQDFNGLKNPTNDPNNSLQLDVGQASLNSGDGQDDIGLFGTSKGHGQDDIFGTFNANTGKGDSELFTLDQEAQKQAEISVDAGDGFDVMQLFGASIKHSFSFKNGKFKMN